MGGLIEICYKVQNFNTSLNRILNFHNNTTSNFLHTLYWLEVTVVTMRNTCNHAVTKLIFHIYTIKNYVEHI